jgi:hypothetical protein
MLVCFQTRTTSDANVMGSLLCSVSYLRAMPRTCTIYNAAALEVTGEAARGASLDRPQRHCALADADAIRRPAARRRSR